MLPNNNLKCGGQLKLVAFKSQEEKGAVGLEGEA